MHLNQLNLCKNSTFELIFLAFFSIVGKLSKKEIVFYTLILIMMSCQSVPINMTKVFLIIFKKKNIWGHTTYMSVLCTIC